MRRFPLYTLLLIFCSCATLSNLPHTETLVRTSQESKIIVEKDTFQTVNKKARIKLKRSSDSVNFQVVYQKDTVTVPLKSKLAPEYYGNIFTNFGIGMIIDNKSLKKYTYPSRVYVNFDNQEDKVLYKKPFQSHNKGDWSIDIFIPYINHFNLNPTGESYKINTGFLGFSLGLNYHYSVNKFLQFSATTASDIVVPFPAPITYDDEYEIMTNSFLSISNHHLIGNFDIGYGVSLGNNIWAKNFTGTENNYYSIRNRTIGLKISTMYRISNSFYMGLLYRPTFFSLKPEENNRYEHLLSFSFGWRVPIIRKK